MPFDIKYFVILPRLERFSLFAPFHFNKNTIYEEKTTEYKGFLESNAVIRYAIFAGGGKKMQVEIKFDNSYREPKIVIFTDRMTPEIQTLMNKLLEAPPQMLAGFREGMLEVLDQREIIRIYAAAGKVFAATENREYQLRLRLYELEERLEPAFFVRISNSEIINLRKVRGFDLRLSGTICVSLLDGTVSYVSRRYVAKMKKLLGI